MKKTLFVFLTVFSLLVCLNPLIAYGELKLGVNAKRGELKAMEEWGELANYLSSEIGQPVKLVPLSMDNLASAIENRNVDILLVNPVQAVIAKEKGTFIPIATLKGKYGSQFAGVIIAKKGNGITKAADLKGKKAMSRDSKSAAGAYIFQAYHLHKQGIDVNKDLSLTEAKKQDDIVLAVRAGIVDAGFIRTGQLESMEKEGKIKMDDFAIVDQKKDSDFPFIHSTVLYPEWFFSASSKVDSKLTAKIKTALLKITPETKASKAANINGFVEPISTEGLKTAMKTLKIAPYNK